MKFTDRKTGAYSLFVFGGFCVLFGLYFFEAYSPLRNSITDPNVILWYPIGLALMLGGVACVVAGRLELNIEHLETKIDILIEASKKKDSTTPSGTA
jgi:hypothetical protein